MAQRYQVGYFNDDAIYILGARSLLHGSYNALFLRRPVPMNDPLPGYSFFLIPFVACVAPHWNALKIVSLAVTLFSGLLYGFLLEEWFSPKIAFLVMLSFAWNPLTVRMAPLVMSETFFVTLSLLAFLIMRQILATESNWLVGCLGILLGWASLARPQGVLLIPSIMMGLFYARRRRASLTVGAIALLLYGAVLWRNWQVTDAALGYFQLWKGAGQGNATRFFAWFEVVYEWGRMLFVRWVLGIQQLPGRYEKLACALVAILSFIGAVNLWRGQKRATPILLSMIIYCGAFSVLQMLWPHLDDRYCFLILPLTLGAFWGGVRSLSQPFLYGKAWLVAAIVCLGVWYGHEDLILIERAISGSDLRSHGLPLQTYDWIRHAIPPDDAIVTDRPATLYLYTQHPSLSLDTLRDRDDFRRWLITNQVSAVLYENHHFASLQTPGFQAALRSWDDSRLWAEASPNVFDKSYQNSSEGTALYRLR